MAGFSFDPASQQFFSDDLFDPLAGLRMPTVASPPMVPVPQDDFGPPPQAGAGDAGILARLLGGDRGYGADADTQRLSVLSSFLDAAGPAAFRAGLTGNKWMAIADTLSGTRKGYEASLQGDYERRRQEAKDARDAAKDQAQIDHLRNTESRAAAADQRSVRERQQRMVGIAKAVKTLSENGAPEVELKRIGVLIEAGDLDAAMAETQKLFSGLPEAEAARAESFLRMEGIKTKAEIAAEEAKYAAGFGERRDDERAERQFNAQLGETRRYHDASIGNQQRDDANAAAGKLQGILDDNVTRADKVAATIMEDGSFKRRGGTYEDAQEKARASLFGAMPMELAVLVDNRDDFWRYRMMGMSWQQILEKARAGGMLGAKG